MIKLTHFFPCLLVLITAAPANAETNFKKKLDSLAGLTGLVELPVRLPATSALEEAPKFEMVRYKFEIRNLTSANFYAGNDKTSAVSPVKVSLIAAADSTKSVKDSEYSLTMIFNEDVAADDMTFLEDDQDVVSHDFVWMQFERTVGKNTTAGFVVYLDNSTSFEKDRVLFTSFLSEDFGPKAPRFKKLIKVTNLQFVLKE